MFDTSDIGRAAARGEVVGSRSEPSALLSGLVGVLVLVAVTTGVLLAARAPAPLAPALAIARGTVQLALVSLVLSGVIRDPALVVVALAVMLSAAIGVAARRIGARDHLVVVAGAMSAGVAVVILVVLGTGALAPSARYLLAIGGIVIGNSMSITTIAGRRFLEATHDRWSEVEGWLALGASPRRATADVARSALSAALIPTVDQTRTTGLVTLPGAFVGAIFGGIPPLEAGRFQLVVLASIMCAGAVTAAILIRSLRGVRVRPAPPR